jgi:cell shape-determining protein MreD
MIRYLVYLIMLYLGLPVSALIDIIAITVFYVALEEDGRFAIIFAFVAGLLIDLYHPNHIGTNMLIYVILTESLLWMKKFLVLNPLTTVATFIVFHLVETALANILVGAPLNCLQIVYTIAVFFPIILVLNRINFGAWMNA